MVRSIKSRSHLGIAGLSALGKNAPRANPSTLRLRSLASCEENHRDERKSEESDS